MEHVLWLLGIQFGFALQNGNVSRIFQTLGANVDDIPILWVAAPLTGLIVQPIIGYWSDKTWGKLGRRRPLFFIRRYFNHIIVIYYAKLTNTLDCSGHVMDHGCID